MTLESNNVLAVGRHKKKQKEERGEEAEEEEEEDKEEKKKKWLAPFIYYKSWSSTILIRSQKQRLITNAATSLDLKFDYN